MNAVLFRAPLINPIGPDGLQWWPDGGLLVQDGRIAASGPFDAVAEGGKRRVVELDGVIVPGFADVHIHWVQHRVLGRLDLELMPWLREHIWPEETRYADPGYCAAAAPAFFDDVVRAGTVMGMSYSSSHPHAARIAAAHSIGDWLIGDSVMVQGAPSDLTGAGVDSIERLDALARELGPQRYALTPRFALNCSRELMAAMGEYARAGGYPVQTHLSESPAEIREVLDTFPEAEDYTDVYDRAGLLGERTVLGHCVHLSEREWAVLAARRCRVAHCPSSNEALDSGRMDLEAVRRHGIAYALASDVGAGPSHSMLHVMQRYLQLHRAADVPLSATEALYRATLAGAQCMGRGAIAGNLAPGKRADFVLLPRPSGTVAPEGWIEEWTQGSMAELENRPMGTWIRGTQKH
ncbi:MAG: amidohydrolase family protein [Gammaproteobacteria bacterium]